MTTVETYRTKEDGFLIIIVKLVEKNKNLVFLLDPWKAGFRDFDTHEGSFTSLKQKLGMPKLRFHKIEKKEAAALLRQNYDIASELGVEIPDNANTWLQKLGVLKIEKQGTLYKCFNCGENDISQEEVDEILAIAREELQEGKIGTEDEEQYFHICEQCKQEMHESHT